MVTKLLRQALMLCAPASLMLAAGSAQALTAAQLQQRKLACMRYWGADAAQMILYQRCIVYGPTLGPPLAKPIPQNLVHPMTGSLVHPMGPLVHPAGGGGCRGGFVWREAAPGDHVCVRPEVRRQARLDNARAGARINPVNHDYGPDTCRGGYVWREATQGDHVCVRPEARQQAAEDNARAGERTAG